MVTDMVTEKTPVITPTTRRYTQINNKPAHGSQEAKYLAVPLLRRIRVHAVATGNRTDYL